MARRIFLPIILVLTVFPVTVFLCGASIWIYFDLPSLILVPVAPFFFMVLSSGWKGVSAAFIAPFRTEATRRDLSLSVSFFKNFGMAIWSFGALGSTSGLIAILAYLTDKTKIGPNAAVALITMLYAAIFNLVLVLPFLSSLRYKVAKMES